MKPTEKQIKVIDTILYIIETWKRTNDIDSPIHISDISDFLYADLESEDIIHSLIADELEDELRSLLYIIQIV